MKLTSPEFKNNEYMPKRFGYKYDNVNPELLIEDIPQGANSLALIMDDPDAPMGTWVHWVMYDMPVISNIEEGAASGKQGINDFRTKKYDGPWPPSGTHRYFFKVYALDRTLGLGDGLTKQEIEKSMEGHILDKAELVGLYKR